ncbi:Peptidyl-prolyl cis-trans isomerase A precursor [Caulifigura coniformis]|uniref:peptidylprolyl isomerase n=1 Tax=Caulifigura coniformis TaxID=2527983 RepID=A0A517SK29_9PLAN|nr:peptidylprolyl isomerase [Caulifigura coniformis]QDT56485.1 Peptidyl-prolyl cis-trans isomerase A precursor [Caulifigura coniformis]
MLKSFTLCLAGAIALTAAACSRTENPANSNGAAAESAPPYYVKFETTKGDFLVEIHPDWAPNGAAHLKELVEKNFYDGCGFFRNVPGFMVQFGMNGDPKVHAEWGEKTIKDDPVHGSNARGVVTYAQTGLPNSRSTQLFINHADNSFLDSQGFSPIGTVVEGLSVVDSLHQTGENPPETQGMIQEQGNEYLKKKYPELDYIKTARIVAKPAEKP